MTINLSEFRKQLLYSVEKQPLLILEDFNQLKTVLQKNKAQRNKVFGYILICVSLIALIFFIIYFLSINNSIIFLIGSLLSCILIIATLYFIIRLFSHPDLNLDSYRYKLFYKIVGLVKRDMAETSALAAKIDFTQPINKKKIINITDHPYRRGWKIKIYQDSWLNVQGKFRDNTKFQLNFIEHNQNIYGWKKSRSGKSKHKSKNKFKGLEIKLKLAFSHRKYGAIQVLQEDAIGAIKLPSDASIKNIKITSKYIQLTVKLLAIKSELIYQTVVMMFLSLYQILNLARILSKSQTSK